MDSILVTKPICSFYGVIEVPFPIVSMHVSKSCVDSTLGSYCVGSSGEQFGNACSLETHFRETEGSSESSTACSNDDCVILVVNDRVVSNQRLALKSKKVKPTNLVYLPLSPLGLP